MSDMIEIGQNLLYEMIQVLFGCLLSFALCKMLHKRETVDELNKEVFLVTLFSALIGLALPVGIFGIIPIVWVALSVGLKHQMVLPMLVSNFVFNMTVPFSDVGFNWKSGTIRVFIAFLMSLLFGWILSHLSLDKNHLIKHEQSLSNSNSLTGIIHCYLTSAGLFLVIGVVLEVLFKKYLYYDVVNVINISSISTSIFSIIEGYDITTPIFIINMILFNLVLNLKTIAGTLFMFKWKGVAGYYVYIGSWVVILSVINIFVSI